MPLSEKYDKRCTAYGGCHQVIPGWPYSQVLSRCMCKTRQTHAVHHGSQTKVLSNSVTHWLVDNGNIDSAKKNTEPTLVGRHVKSIEVRKH